MLVMSQSIGRDIYALTIKKNATSQEVVRVTRWAVVGIAVVACLNRYVLRRAVGADGLEPPLLHAHVLMRGHGAVGPQDRGVIYK